VLIVEVQIADLVVLELQTEEEGTVPALNGTAGTGSGVKWSAYDCELLLARDRGALVGAENVTFVEDRLPVGVEGVYVVWTLSGLKGGANSFLSSSFQLIASKNGCCRMLLPLPSRFLGSLSSSYKNSHKT